MNDFQTVATVVSCTPPLVLKAVKKSRKESCDGRHGIYSKTPVSSGPSTPVLAATPRTAFTAEQGRVQVNRERGASHVRFAPHAPTASYLDVEPEAQHMPTSTPVAFAILLGTARSQQTGYQYTDEECKEAFLQVKTSRSWWVK
jgi:hypothetical protein